MAAASSGYVAAAEERVAAILDEHLAVVYPELLGRVCETLDSDKNIDPHHVTTALRNLTAAGLITDRVSRARGGRDIRTIHPVNVRLRKTQLNRTAARKRLLMARWQGWTQGTNRFPHGTVGPSGERAARQALAISGALAPMTPGFEEVFAPLGVPLQGSLDSGGFLVTTDAAGVPTGSVISMLIEVKSIRSWIYPSSEELYQLLHKCVLVQEANPSHPIIPILICRRAHPTVYYMAQQVGFLVIETEVQFVGSPGLDRPSDMEELRTELFLRDLAAGDGPALRVRDRLRSQNLINGAPKVASEWSTSVADSTFRSEVRLARRSKSSSDRESHVANLRTWNVGRGRRGGW